MSSLSHKTRKGIRRDTRKLEGTFGDRLSVAILRLPDELERLVHDSDQVAGSTYQRRLGVGFADTMEQRAVARLGLEHGWVRGYLLYLDGEPVAYWLCTVFGGTMLLKNGGFDAKYGSYRTGIYLLMRVIEDRRRPRARHARLRTGRRRLQAAVQQRELRGTQRRPLRADVPGAPDQRGTDGDPRARTPGPGGARRRQDDRSRAVGLLGRRSL